MYVVLCVIVKTEHTTVGPLGVFFSLALFSRVHATLQPALSVRPSVGWSVGHTLLFL